MTVSTVSWYTWFLCLKKTKSKTKGLSVPGQNYAKCCGVYEYDIRTQGLVVPGQNYAWFFHLNEDNIRTQGLPVLDSHCG